MTGAITTRKKYHNQIWDVKNNKLCYCSCRIREMGPCTQHHSKSYYFSISFFNNSRCHWDKKRKGFSSPMIYEMTKQKENSLTTEKYWKALLSQTHLNTFSKTFFSRNFFLGNKERRFSAWADSLLFFLQRFNLK